MDLMDLLFPPQDGFIVFRVKITRLRNGGNYAEINQNYAMGNFLMKKKRHCQPIEANVKNTRRDIATVIFRS